MVVESDFEINEMTPILTRDLTLLVTTSSMGTVATVPRETASAITKFEQRPSALMSVIVHGLEDSYVAEECRSPCTRLQPEALWPDGKIELMHR